MHSRLQPVRHRFEYRVFSLLIDLDELPMLARRLRPLSHNRFNLMSLYDRDHGDAQARRGDARLGRSATLAAAGLSVPGGRIELLVFPGFWGMFSIR